MNYSIVNLQRRATVSRVGASTCDRSHPPLCPSRFSCLVIVYNDNYVNSHSDSNRTSNDNQQNIAHPPFLFLHPLPRPLGDAPRVRTEVTFGRGDLSVCPLWGFTGAHA